MAMVCVLLVALGGLAIYTVNKVDTMQGTIDRLQSEKNTTTAADGKDVDVDKLRKELAEQKKTIEQQQNQIAEQNGTIEEQQGTIDQQQDTIDEQQDTIEQQQDTIEKQEDTIENQKGTIDQQKETIDDLKVQIKLNETKPGDPNLPVMGPFEDYEGQKIVALTFDDGPGPYTERLLNELKARNARATFFVLGTRVDAYPNLIRRMAEEGHVVGNHSNAHNMLHRMDLLGVRNEMGKCAEKIEKLLGYRPCVMRCPGGNSSSTVIQYAKEAAIPIINWSVDTRDWESRNKEAILKVAKANIKDGSIVLLHDIHQVSVEATIELMDWLIEQGYTMVTVPELLSARQGGMEAGKTYR